MATPALRALRAALPRTRITWAGGRVAHQALEGLPWRDDVLSLDGPMARGAGAPFRAGRLMRGLGADATLLLPGSFSTALAARLARVPVRVGTPSHARRALLTHVVEVPTASDRPVPRPMREHYLDLAAAFGASRPAGAFVTELAVTEHDARRAAARLAGAPKDVRLLAVAPGASFGPSKVVPPERLALAVREVRERARVLPLVLAAPGEEALAEETARRIGVPCLAPAGEPPDVGELKALVRRCAVLLGPDAGPRHVAEALGVPTVVVAGPTDPRWGAGGSAEVVRNEALPCLGCHLRRCPIGHPCLAAIDPGLVAAAVLRALSVPPPGPG
jgi:ADP-heptose:LPS heptosyltransferase